MYEYDARQQPLGLINLARSQMYSQGLGVIQPSEAHLFSGMGTIQPSEAQLFRGMGAIQPSEAHLFGCDPSIDECCLGNCQNPALGNVSTPAPRPWYFYVGVGLGIAGALYMVRKSGILKKNPEDMTDSEAAQMAAAIAVQARVPTILWGPPGIGKTSWLQALGNAMDAEVFTIIGSTKDPADIGGIMTLKGRTIAPMWAQEIAKRSKQKKRSLLFLDEFTSMSPLVHAALLRVVYEKVAGDLAFDPTGKYVSVVAAANRPEEGAGAMPLPPPAANRLIHINWVAPSVIEWGVGLLTEWPMPKLPALPSNWARTPQAAAAKNDVAAFVAYQQQYMLEVPADAGGAWPSPRSWDNTAKVLGAARVVDAPDRVQFRLVSGAVGAVVAKKFFDWLNANARDMPKIERILQYPESYDIAPGRPDKLYDVGRAALGMVRKDPTPENYEAAWRFLIETHNRVLKARQRPEPLSFAADQLLEMLDDPKYKAKLKDAEVPDEKTLSRFLVEGVQVF
jgi:MoxR-like ATPase